MKEKGKNILIIDDSTTNVVLLEAILHRSNFQTITASNAKDAWEIVRRSKPSLILLDLLMPEISGFEFLENLKKNEDTADIPVVVISALTDNENVKMICEMGAVEYIKKPVDIQYLVNTVKKILNEKQV